MTTQLPPEFKIVELSSELFQTYWNDWGPKIFSDDTSLDTRKILSEAEKSQMKILNSNLAGHIRLNLGIFKGDQFCGWFTGEQSTYESFYMKNSGILPEFRRLGLYTALMNDVIQRVQAMGFQVIFSRHTTTNNTIIIPKLKAGFMITAIEVSDRFGTLVHLSYFFNETRKKVMIFRSGDLKPDTILKDALGIN